MNGDAANQLRGRTIFLILSVVCALGVFLLWLAFGSAKTETITFTVINAQTGAAVTNVGVKVYRQKHPLLKELSEFTDRPLMDVEELRVSSKGVVETVGPHPKRLLSVSFTPGSNFAPLIFNRSPQGDHVSHPGELRSVLRPGRTNRITIALQPASEQAKP